MLHWLRCQMLRLLCHGLGGRLQQVVEDRMLRRLCHLLWHLRRNRLRWLRCRRWHWHWWRDRLRHRLCCWLCYWLRQGLRQRLWQRLRCRLWQRLRHMLRQ